MMRWVCFLVLFSAASAVATAQQPNEQPQAERRANVDNLLKMVRDPLEAFRAEKPPRCDFPNLVTAASRAMHIAVELVERKKLMGDLGLLLGSATLDLADAAREFRCLTRARDLYDFVIAIYVGQDYAEIRMRAVRSR